MTWKVGETAEDLQGYGGIPGVVIRDERGYAVALCLGDIDPLDPLENARRVVKAINIAPETGDDTIVSVTWRGGADMTPPAILRAIRHGADQFAKAEYKPTLRNGETLSISFNAELL